MLFFAFLRLKILTRLLLTPTDIIIKLYNFFFFLFSKWIRMCVQPPHGVLWLKILPGGEKFFSGRNLMWMMMIFLLFCVEKEGKAPSKKVLYFHFKPVGVLTTDEEHCFSEMKIHIIPLNEHFDVKTFYAFECKRRRVSHDLAGKNGNVRKILMS